MNGAVFLRKTLGGPVSSARLRMKSPNLTSREASLLSVGLVVAGCGPAGSEPAIRTALSRTACEATRGLVRDGCQDVCAAFANGIRAIADSMPEFHEIDQDAGQ